MKLKGVVCVVPTLNEAAAIGDVIRDLKEHGAGKIVVLDGHSTDDTVKIAKKLGAQVMVQEGRGKGLAFQTFLKKYPIKACEKYVMLDGDGSYPAKHLPEFSKKLESFDVVSGHRPLIRKLGFYDVSHFIGNKMLSLAGLVLYGKWIDICTGYWGFKGMALKKMKIAATGFDLEADIFSNTRKLKLSHESIHVDYLPRIGTPKLRNADAIAIITRLVANRFS